MASKRRNLDVQIGFIDYEDDETDISLSLAIYEDGEYTDSLILARSSFDLLLSDSEQGARLSYGDVLDDSIHPILLQEASMRGSVIELTCETHRFTLDLSKIEAEDIEVIEKQLTKLNFDNRFILHINDGSETQTDGQ